MNKISFVLSALLLSASFSMAKEVKIGVVLPVTGAIAAYGQVAWSGIELANELEPKLKNGDTVKLVLVDNKGDRVETATAATRLVSKDNVTGIIGAMTTGNTQQVLQIADEKKVPIITPGATSDKLLDRSKYGARVTFMDSFQGTGFANYAINHGFKTAILVTDQSAAYSLGLAKAFKKEFIAKGGKILSELKISSGDKDFKAIVSQIQSQNPQIVYMPIYHPEASLILRQAKQIGLKTQFASGDGAASDTFIELSGDAAEGFLYTDVFDSSNPSTKLGSEFVNAYKQKSKKDDISGFTALGADAYFLMVDAMNRCENPSDTQCVNKEIKNTKKFDGVSGEINIDAKGNAIRSLVIKEIKNAKAVYKDVVNP